MDNTVNDLRLEIKFQNRVKDKSNFLLSETLLFFFFFFFAEPDTKRHRNVSAKVSNAALVKLTD